MENLEDSPIKIVVRENGPYVIEQNVELIMPDGRTEKKSLKVSLCRCGLSNNKPYCDGKHKTVVWDIKETERIQA